MQPNARLVRFLFPFFNPLSDSVPLTNVGERAPAKSSPFTRFAMHFIASNPFFFISRWARRIGIYREESNAS